MPDGILTKVVVLVKRTTLTLRVSLPALDWAKTEPVKAKTEMMAALRIGFTMIADSLENADVEGRRRVSVPSCVLERIFAADAAKILRKA